MTVQLRGVRERRKKLQPGKKEITTKQKKVAANPSTTTAAAAATTTTITTTSTTSTTTGVPLNFCPGSRLEDVQRCKKRGRRRLSWTSVKKSLAKTVALGGRDATDCSGVGFGAIRAGSFLPVKAAGGCKTVAELAPSMTLKSHWVQKP